jgi:hypothetical protein
MNTTQPTGVRYHSRWGTINFLGAAMLALLTCFTFVWSPVALGDAITLNSGNIIEGRVVAETETDISFEALKYPGIIKTYAKSEIRTIRRDKSPGASQPAPPPPPPHLSEGAENRNPFTFKGNGFDFIVFLSKERNAKLAVDPDLVGLLSMLEVEIPEPSTATTLELVQKHLKGVPMVTKTVSLGPKVQAMFITSPSAWIYFDAVAKVRNGQLDGAFQVLNGTLPEDRSHFRNQCANLQSSLGKIVQRRSEACNLRREVDLALNKFQHAKSGMEAADQAARGAMNEKVAEVAAGFGGEVLPKS